MSAQFQTLADFTILAQDSEGGSGRMYWFIALMIILGIQHISEKLKEKRAEEINQQRGNLQEEEELEDEWEEDAGSYHDPNPSNDTLLDFFRSVAQDQKVEPVAPPPPVVVDVPKPRPPASSGGTLSRAEQAALDKLKEGKSHLTHGRTNRQRMHASAEHSELGRMLRNPVSLRNAFILKEILEPPLAARENQEPHSTG